MKVNYYWEWEKSFVLNLSPETVEEAAKLSRMALMSRTYDGAKEVITSFYKGGGINTTSYVGNRQDKEGTI